MSEMASQRGKRPRNTECVPVGARCHTEGLKDVVACFECDQAGEFRHAGVVCFELPDDSTCYECKRTYTFAEGWKDA